MVNCQRDEFSLPDGIHYLNCAYMSPLSKRVERAGIAALKRKRYPSSITPPDFFEDLALLRGLFARVLGTAQADRVAVIPSVSYGVATAARNTALSRGQNVVVLEHQFPSNVYAWRRVAGTAGAEVRVVPAPEGHATPGAEWNTRLLEALDARTAAVALPQVHWTDGTVFDLERVGLRAREVGAALIVDATQSVGAYPFAMDRIRPDAVICAGYKWLLGPYGLGLAYYGSRYDGGVPLEETWLSRPGSEDFRRLVEYGEGYREGAARYDMGEASSFALVPMLVAALEQILEWSVAGIGEYSGRLTEAIAREARDVGFGVVDEPFRAPHILGLTLPEAVEPEGALRALARRSVQVSARGNALRISPHVYNEDDDVAALVEGLRALSERRATA